MDSFYRMFKDITILELISFIPLLLLFAYLPKSNIFNIFINVIIIILCCFGISFLFYIFKNQKSDKE